MAAAARFLGLAVLAVVKNKVYVTTVRMVGRMCSWWNMTPSSGGFVVESKFEILQTRDSSTVRR